MGKEKDKNKVITFFKINIYGIKSYLFIYIQGLRFHKHD